MTDQIISELLVLFLLVITCSRIFFQKHVKTDPIATVPIIALIISILNLFINGISISTIVVFILSFFVFIWNLRALFRLNANLVVDHYGPWFIFISIVNLLLVLVVGVTIFIFRPVSISASNSNVSESVTRYVGSFLKGFEPATKIFQFSSAQIFEYESSDKEYYERNSFIRKSKKSLKEVNGSTEKKSKGVVLFIPSACSTSKTYRPFLIKLAEKGYKVYSADFYSKEMPWFGNFLDSFLLKSFSFKMEKIFNQKEYGKMISNSKYKFAKEYETFIKIVNPSEEETVILVGEDPAKEAFPIVLKGKQSLVDFTFCLDEVEGYTTKGWGPVEQTNPCIAKFLGYKRDSSLYMSAHLANIVEKSIEDFKRMQESVLEFNTEQTLEAKK